MKHLKKLNDSFNRDNTNTRQVVLLVANVTNITSQQTNQRIIQNFRLIWLDSSIDEYTNEDSIYTISKLQEIVYTIEKFTDVNQCLNFVTDIKDEQIFMICTGELGQTIVPIIHDIPQINCIYIFCQNKLRHEQWVKDWSKVQGIYTDITSVCQALKQVAYDCDQNLVSINFVQAGDELMDQDLSTLDQSFIYMQILKEILLASDFEQSHFIELLNYCREQLNGNITELRNIDNIEMEYHNHQPIWWSTYNCFLYSMLNRALRTMEVDLIVKIGFFVRDLHNDIVRLHAKQFSEQNQSSSFTVYRGQGLSQTDFDYLNNTKGGLLSFNNFLSTSKNYDVSLNFARRTITTSDLVGILFVIQIDPSLSITTTFANITNVSYYQKGEEEEEILFSINSIFRIEQITQVDEDNRLWQVDLILISDSDPQLHILIKRMQQEISLDYRRWHRLDKLILQLSHVNKVEKLHDTLLQQTNDKPAKTNIYFQQEHFKQNQEKYTKMIIIFEQLLQIHQKLDTLEHPDVVECYKDIDGMYMNTSEYSKALSYYEKALEIQRKTLPEVHFDLATSYNNIGDVYKRMNEYSKSLSYYQKALEIYQKTLPENHSNFVTSYNNIGEMYDKMGTYFKALSFYEKALQIRQRTFPENHPYLAISYDNIGGMNLNMGKYSKAILNYEKALEIYQKTLPENHPTLAIISNNIGLVYDTMDEYSKALLYYEKAHEIRERILPTNHPTLAISYNNMAFVFENMGNFLKALSYFEHASEIFECSLPPGHPYVEAVKENIEIVRGKL